MKQDIEKLSEKEKEALRLLLVGHDTKSTARALNLSVHTINDRLRDARRKLGVTSSREAARLLGESEQAHPDFLVGKEIGADETSKAIEQSEQLNRPPRTGYSFTWLAGGMLIMSLIVAAAAIVSSFGSGGQPETTSASAITQMSVPTASQESQNVAVAQAWLLLLDQKKWQQSWREADPFFQANVSESSWQATASGLRQQLGSVQTRTVQSVSQIEPQPNGPAGNQILVRFKTTFAKKPDSVETVVLTSSSTDWKVVGYFVA